MDQITRKRVEGIACCVGMLFVGLFSSAGVCHADLANLQKLTVNITTVDVPGGWTNKGSGVNAEFICNAIDNSSSASGTSSGTDKPCDNGNHTSYVRTDDEYKGVESDGWIKPVDRNFTIHVSAPSAAKVRIEWTSKANKRDLPNTDEEWKTGLVHGSYTCAGQSCDVCIVGGTCAHPVLPSAALSVQSDGSQSTLFIRVNACDGNKYVKTGWDKIKDKYVKFEICGVGCGGEATVPDNKKKPTPDPTPIPDPIPTTDPTTCDPENGQPKAFTTSATNTKDSCELFQYRLEWSFVDSGDTQSGFEIQIREYTAAATKNTTYTYVSTPSNGKYNRIQLLNDFFLNLTPATSPRFSILYGKVYEWRVRVTDADLPNNRPDCRKTSEWSAWTGISGKSIKTDANKSPDVYFTVTNAIGADCLDKKCLALEKLTFSDNNSKIYTGGSTTKQYQWYLGGVAVSDEEGGKQPSFTKQFYIADKKGYDVKLEVTDSMSLTCAASGYIEFGYPTPIWNEVTPK